MAEIPKFVRQRLQKTAHGGNHPDADTLTAFMERQLPQAERSSVLHHLASCAECREIVWLSLPSSEAQMVVAPQRTRSMWRVWQWGALTAGVVVVAGVVWVSQEQQNLRGKLSTAHKPESQVIEAPKHAIEAPQKNAQERSSPAAISKDVPTEARSHSAGGPSPTARLRESELARIPKRAEAPPQRPEPVLPAAMPAPPASGKADSFTDEVAVRGGVGAGSGAGYGMAAGNAASEVSKAQAEPSPRSDTVAAAAARPTVPDPQTMARDSVTTEVAQAAAKTGEAERDVLAAQGSKKFALRKSKANERKQETIDVKALGALPPMRLTSHGHLQSLASTNGAPVWRNLKVNDGDRLVVIALKGAEVWLGSEKGFLYRSNDSGETWQMIDPKVGNASIATLKFFDEKTGELTTRSGSSWTTIDGGATWQRKSN
jgi:hypothetical protein